MWEILISNWQSAAENSNKFPKNQVFSKEKPVEDMVTTWANGTGHRTSTYSVLGNEREESGYRI
jgi:hypothetical protein